MPDTWSVRGTDRRFVCKALRETEIPLWTDFPLPALGFWAIWSAKEAGYKYCQQLEPGGRFNPMHFEVRELRDRPDSGSYPLIANPGKGASRPRCLEGNGKARGRDWSFRTWISDAWIFTLCALESGALDRIRWGIGLVPPEGPIMASRLVRELLLEAYNREFPESARSSLHILRDIQGIPRLSGRGFSDTVPVSLSHDGTLVAWSYYPVPVRTQAS